LQTLCLTERAKLRPGCSLAAEDAVKTGCSHPQRETEDGDTCTYSHSVCTDWPTRQV